MVLVKFRHGLGFDFEANDQICYRVHYQDGTDDVMCFDGTIIRLPLLTIHIGDFIPIGEFDD